MVNSDNVDNIVDKKIIHDLAYYAIFANAAYSWTLGLLPGQFHWGKFAALSRKTGVLRHNIIAANWKAETCLPVSKRMAAFMLMFISVKMQSFPCRFTSTFHCLSFVIIRS